MRRIRTWHLELIVVAAALGGLAGWRGSAIEVLCAGAVLASFAHAQVAERLRERDAARTEPDVECHRWLWRYFVVKEIFWVAYFVVTGAHAALLGCAVFLIYPAWRTWWRRRHPIKERIVLAEQAKRRR